MSINFFNGIFNNNSKAENHHNTEGLKERYDLIARILNAKTSNEGLEEYQSVLDNEFLEFASGVDSLKEKEIALLMLQEIKKELQLVAQATLVCSKKPSLRWGEGLARANPLF